MSSNDELCRVVLPHSLAHANFPGGAALRLLRADLPVAEDNLRLELASQCGVLASFWSALRAAKATH